MGTVIENLHEFCGTYLFWFPDFAQSPGFAGCLAVVAAGIAYIATTRNSRKEQWWKRAEYALNLTLAAEETTQITGLEMLDALESKSKRERLFIEAATQWFLSKEEPAGVVSAPAGQEPPADLNDEEPIPTGKRARIFSAVRGIFRRPRA
jgi:hypothetical protein